MKHLKLLIGALSLAACAMPSPYRATGVVEVDEPVDRVLNHLRPIEQMEEAICSLHDFRDQAARLQGVITLKGKKINLNTDKAAKLPPVLRVSVSKMDQGIDAVGKARQELSQLEQSIDGLVKKYQKSSDAAVQARLKLATDELDSVGPRLKELARESANLLAQVERGILWPKPRLCQAVETRRAAQLVAMQGADESGSVSRVLARIKAYEERLEQARQMNADRCAPKHLAEAEAYADFARLEIRLGNWFKAQEAAKAAGVAAIRTLEEARPCAPKPKKPKLPAVVEKKDSDNDGIVDLEDKCPDLPGLSKYEGCPPPDRDGDGFLDEEDKCPEQPEDFDGNQDTDGCPEQEDTDSDNDGILDADDKCPTDPEDRDGFEETDGCPDRDNDSDGVLDADDHCPGSDGAIGPDVQEDRDGYQDTDGCPDPDNDGDGIPDDRDQCKNDKEDIDQFQDEDGCPERDNDQDGVPDEKDKCPTEKEVINGVNDDDGCPDKKYTLIKVTKEAIKITQKIQFASGKAKIKKVSHPILDEVADAIVTHRIQKILVEGHTDDVGRDSYNLRLSQKRADAVRNYLIRKGVKAERLDAIGFGETRPLVKGKSRKARATNRRVEFKIIER